MNTQTQSKQASSESKGLTVNGIHLETLQSTVQAIQSDPGLGACKFRAINTWLGGNHNCVFR